MNCFIECQNAIQIEFFLEKCYLSTKTHISEAMWCEQHTCLGLIYIYKEVKICQFYIVMIPSANNKRNIEETMSQFRAPWNTGCPVL